MAWLTASYLVESGDGSVARENVHFEETREGKVRRIAAIGCDLFIDDLPEVLLHPEFPRSTRPILFYREIAQGMPPNVLAFATWESLSGALETLLSRAVEGR